MHKQNIAASLLFLVLFICAGVVVYTGQIESDPYVGIEIGTGEDAYWGSAEGFGGELSLEVVVENSTILEVRILEHGETPNIAGPALEDIPRAIVSEQSLDVGILSGATFSSEAVIKATERALESAGWVSDPE